MSLFDQLLLLWSWREKQNACLNDGIRNVIFNFLQNQMFYFIFSVNVIQKIE